MKKQNRVPATAGHDQAKRGSPVAFNVLQETAAHAPETGAVPAYKTVQIGTVNPFSRAGQGRM